MPVSTLAKRIKVSFVGSCEKFYTVQENGVPLVRTTNLTANGYDEAGLKFVTREFHLKNLKSQLRRGDVLVARHGENGRACEFTGNEANCLNVIIIEPDYDKVLSVFLVYALNSSEARRQVGGRVVGSTQHVLNTADLAKIKIANPSLNRQREFAAFVAEVDKSEFAARKRLEKARQLYRAKLQEYFG